ncbi:hypothetical protein C7S13_1319 [Burkholderia cepacia]|nr:hypothetical protein [Burkholderia cepacia]
MEPSACVVWGAAIFTDHSSGQIAHTYCGYSGSINFAELIHGRVPAGGPAWTRSHGRAAAWHMRAGRER